MFRQKKGLAPRSPSVTKPHSKFIHQYYWQQVLVRLLCIKPKYLPGRSVSSDRERSDKDKKKVENLVVDVCTRCIFLTGPAPKISTYQCQLVGKFWYLELFIRFSEFTYWLTFRDFRGGPVKKYTLNKETYNVFVYVAYTCFFAKWRFLTGSWPIEKGPVRTCWQTIWPKGKKFLLLSPTGVVSLYCWSFSCSWMNSMPTA